MINSGEQRWRQRLESFGAALARLDEACEQDTYTNLERAGLIKTFEFTYELGWKVLKELLYYEGQDLSSPRAVIRKSFEFGFFGEDDCETYLDALGKRDLLSHTYRDDLAQEAEVLIKRQYRPMLRRLRRTLERTNSA